MSLEDRPHAAFHRPRCAGSSAVPCLYTWEGVHETHECHVAGGHAGFHRCPCGAVDEASRRKP